MGKRTTKKGARPAPVSADRLREGWPPTPGSARIRLARAQDTDAADALLGMAGVRLTPALRSAIEDGTAASILLGGLGGTTNAFFKAAARSFVTQSMAESMSGISMTLIAADGEDQVLGVLSVTAPGSIINKALDSGYDPPRALTLGVAVAKIHGLAVAEAARGQGIASALLRMAWQVHEQLGYFLLYGSYATERELGPLYTRCGYTVLAPGEGFTLDSIGLPFGVHAGPNERVFTRWRPHR
ncbi:GNAT family N-acetyltransferase [Streptomyces sp. NPDC087420]|uniref:GNAT family N-acetyltransferase n=1 Tax=Streptomyces sp. NPDC087420 TaxID=3365785 RepID=UPI003836C044